MAQSEERPSTELEIEKTDAVYVEDADDGSDPQCFEPAEMEAKLNWQTILAYLVRQTSQTSTLKIDTHRPSPPNSTPTSSPS